MAREYVPPTEEQLAEQMRKWGISNRSLAEVWYERCSTQTWWARGVEFPGVWNGQQGSFLAVSTPESSQIAKMSDNAYLQGLDQGISLSLIHI